jgi:hypothetical protein
MISDKLRKKKRGFQNPDKDDRFILGHDVIDFETRPYLAFLSVFLIRFGMSMAFGEFTYHPD